MQFLILIGAYLCYLFAGCFACLGWHVITRGREEILPDGTIKKTGKLLKFWHFFWTRKAIPKYNYVLYKGVELRKKFDTLNDHKHKFLNAQLKIDDDYEHIIIEGEKKALIADLITKTHREYFENLLDGTPSQDMNTNIILAKKMPNYYFPEWVRDWLSECPTCAASLYGSIFYWSIYFITDNAMLRELKHPLISAFVCWVFFAFSLAYLNTVLAKKAT